MSRNKIITYRSNPELKFVDQNRKGNEQIDGKFSNGDLQEPVPFWDALKWQFGKKPQQQEKKNEIYSLPVVPFNSLSEHDQIVWLGHSTFLIQIGGIRMITDPVFFNIPARKRKIRMPCNINNITNVDYLLISHTHFDHYDKRSVKKLILNNRDMKALVPLEAKRLFNKGMLKDIAIQEAGWYQEYKLDRDIRIIFMPANHWTRRSLNDYNRTLWGSFLIIKDNKKIFFAGDSRYSSIYKDIHHVVGDIDICLLPIGAYSPSFIMARSHMNPEEALHAFEDLHGKIFIPMHYGTFDLSDEPLGEPVRKLKEYALKKNYHEQTKILAVGEKFFIE